MSVTWPVRVYVEDTDFGGVVYYANYLRWLERARTEWLRSKVNYRRPARLDDELIISCEPRADGRASVRFVQQVLRGAELLADADVRVACLAASTLRPTRLPEFVIAEVG